MPNGQLRLKYSKSFCVVMNGSQPICKSPHRVHPIPVELRPAHVEAPSRGQVLTHWKRTRKWALVDPLGSKDPVPCRLVARGVGRYAACKGSAAEAVAPLTIRHRLPFAHYSAEYAARLACKNECSASCAAAGECRAPERRENKLRLENEGSKSK